MTDPTPSPTAVPERIDLPGGWYFVRGANPWWLLCDPDHRIFQGGWQESTARAFAAALVAPPAEAGPGAVPSGWRLVPEQPTEEMVGAIRKRELARRALGNREALTDAEAYRAMLAAAPSAPALTVAGDGSKSDAEIVKEVSDLARKVLRWIGTGYEVPTDFMFYGAKDPRAIKAWNFAVEIYEDFTATEVHDAVEGERDRLDDLPPEPTDAPAPDRALREAAQALLKARDNHPCLDMELWTALRTALAASEGGVS